MSPIRRIELIGGEDNYLAVLTDDTCLVHDFETEEASPIWVRCDDERVATIAGSPAEPRLAICRVDGQVAVVDAETLDRVWDRSIGAVSISSAVFSPDGRTLVVGTGQGFVLLLDAATGDVRQRVSVDSDVRAARFTPDGRHLIVPQAGDALSIRDAATMEEVRRIPTARGQVMAMAVSPDGKAVAVGTSFGEVWLHNLAAVREPVRVWEEFLPVLALTFGAEGEWLAMGLADRSIRLYSADGLGPLESLAGHPFGTRDMVPSGDSLLSAGLDGRVVAWDVSTRKGRELMVH
jgi:WD40 repeat protein